MLIPMVKIIRKPFNNHEDDSGIQTMKGELQKPGSTIINE